jgi:2,3-bisphosphoglycerate-independent phosphoglycerate mutase
VNVIKDINIRKILNKIKIARKRIKKGKNNAESMLSRWQGKLAAFHVEKSQ